MLPTAKKLLDWAIEGADRWQRYLNDSPQAAPVERALATGWRDAYLELHCQLSLSLPRLIDEATLLPDPDAERLLERVA